MQRTCDIFCTVVDNFGDIGVCWRLSKQLTHEHGIAVRLWVDDLSSFKKLCAEIDVDCSIQHLQGVEARHWRHTEDAFDDIQPAHIVLETFASRLPETYLAAMAAMPQSPAWINLEHLSAEKWVADYHGLPSPHPTLPLIKYYFFPGFTEATGGLLLENNLLTRRDALRRDPLAQAQIWQKLGVQIPQEKEIRVSLFCYENAALSVLLKQWAEGVESIFCVVPEGRILPQMMEFFKRDAIKIGDGLQQGNLRVQILPFMAQENYDELLWVCDINFVRGEDSFVRALWAGQPCVWHIYPQHDQVHLQKLNAFLESYCANLPTDIAVSVIKFWAGWNKQQDVATAWAHWLTYRSQLQRHSQTWAAHLARNNLALNLLNFIEKTDRMRASHH